VHLPVANDQFLHDESLLLLLLFLSGLTALALHHDSLLLGTGCTVSAITTGGAIATVTAVAAITTGATVTTRATVTAVATLFALGHALRTLHQAPSWTA
jgi:hypothetical protein